MRHDTRDNLIGVLFNYEELDKPIGFNREIHYCSGTGFNFYVSSTDLRSAGYNEIPGHIDITITYSVWHKPKSS